MNDRIKESDWKVFKKLRPLALERYCTRVIKEVEDIIQDKNKDAHERYSELYKTVRDRDKRLAQMFDGFSRSRALFQLVMYHGDGLLTDEEIAELSEENRERIISILELRDK